MVSCSPALSPVRGSPLHPGISHHALGVVDDEERPIRHHFWILQRPWTVLHIASHRSFPGGPSFQESMPEGAGIKYYSRRPG